MSKLIHIRSFKQVAPGKMWPADVFSVTGIFFFFFLIFADIFKWEIVYLKSGYLISLANWEDPALVGQQPTWRPLARTEW